MGQGTVRPLPNSQVRTTLAHSRAICLSALIGLCPYVLSCSTAPKPAAETPPPAAATPADQAQQTAKLPTPELNDVQQAVKRVFKEAVLIDTQHKPIFVAGDFNGDLSQDVAVVLKPVPEKLSEMNEEFPMWILRDPFAPVEPGKPRPRVTENEALLAVIHGYGAKGWHDPQATQTYLLKNAVGSGMETHTRTEFVARNQGKKLPRLAGDVIGETLKGTSGYLYYSRAAYFWYDPKTFAGEPEPLRGHGRPDKGMKK
jgi:hypothetical protein